MEDRQLVYYFFHLAGQADIINILKKLFLEIKKMLNMNSTMSDISLKLRLMILKEVNIEYLECVINIIESLSVDELQELLPYFEKDYVEKPKIDLENKLDNVINDMRYSEDRGCQIVVSFADEAMYEGILLFDYAISFFAFYKTHFAKKNKVKIQKIAVSPIFETLKKFKNSNLDEESPSVEDFQAPRR